MHWGINPLPGPQKHHHSRLRQFPSVYWFFANHLPKKWIFQWTPIILLNLPPPSPLPPAESGEVHTMLSQRYWHIKFFKDVIFLMLVASWIMTIGMSNIQTSRDHLNNPIHLHLRERYPYSELFWSAFSRIRTEYCIQSECGKMRTRITANTDTFHADVIHFRKKALL